MLSEVKIWVLIAAVTVMASILGFIIKVVTAQVIKRLDDIVNELKHLTRITTLQEEQIKGLQNTYGAINRRLDSHATRIHNIELKIKQE